MPEMHWK